MILPYILRLPGDWKEIARRYTGGIQEGVLRS
jgi:hypothetical protein